MNIHSIQLTEKASNAIVESIVESGENINDVFLRVGANKGGCSGWRWELETEPVDNKKETDLIFNNRDITVIVDKNILNDVIGSVKIDYDTKNMVEQGFVFIRSTGQQCGCGESFTPVNKI
jgi:iron-sulfur cluster assembly accessory protein